MLNFLFHIVKLSNPAKRAKDSQVPERDRRRERTLLNNNNMNEIYWITRLDAIQTLAIIAVFILGVFTFLYILVWIMEDDEKDKSKLKKSS